MRLHRKKETPNDRMEWFTPPEMFAQWNEEFQFTLDPCAPIEKEHQLPVKHHYTRQDNGLILPWHGRVYVNPPWGWHLTSRWVEKAALESKRLEVELIAMLVPSQTDTEWFHDYVLEKAEIRFLRGRCKMFNGKGEVYRGRIGSMLIIWRDPGVSA